QGSDYLVRISGMQAALKFNQILASVAPVSDFTGHIRRMQARIFLFAGLVMGVVVPLVLLISRRISTSLMRLERESMKIRQFDFSESEPFDSGIKEIHAHIQAFILMKSTIRDRTDALIATQKKLETLVQSGIALTAEDDMDQLLGRIFASARALARADGGVLYLRDEADNLRFEIMQHADGRTLRADTADKREAFAPIPIQAPEAGQGRPRQVERQVALTGQTVVVNQLDDQSGFDFSDACRPDEAAGLVCRNFLTAPLRTREGKTIGVLQVFNARDEKTGDITAFNTEIVGFVEALAAQAAVALHNKRLLEEQRVLFDALIQLIADAIDAKSPYTGGHCARVPQVAAMLARAAHEIKEGPLARFRMETEDQWREFNVAAWLHDCGKVTTPEYVVDKATKLETLYNRIHEIRMRFEVLWRDAEIAYLQKRLAGGTDEKTLDTELEKTRQQILEDFAFVAQCNIGGEFMADAKIERLQRIASRTWVRHLDDRLGISADEAQLKNREPAPDLPVVENVLADKPEHIIPRTHTDPFDGNPFGFKMAVPKDQYNLGELYNLCIRKGTLSPEERFKINEHIIQTIKMLKKLPFPEYLQNVAEFAGSHHETMIGTGYPRGLRKEEMPIPARIMAIADIFEALTAADRPYKKPKRLSDALRIMSRMRNDQHIDAELFDLFLQSRVYQTYAEQFLNPAQIDEVKIEDYLATKAP
ncbi:MAG: GAF domain-containing protein, partial [Desulfobacterales bacterium]